MIYVLRSILWILVLYVFIFQPPVIPKLTYLVLQLAIICVLFCVYGRRIFRAFSLIKWEISLLFVVLVISCLRDLLTGSVVYFDRFLGWGFQAFLVSATIVVMYEGGFRGRRIELGFDKAIYLSIVLASAFTLALYFLPEFDNWYESIQLDKYYEIYSSFDKRYRAYGIAENLTFTYSFVLGLAAGMTLIYARFNLAYLIFFPALIFGVAVNARIGFIGICFVMFYLLLFGGFRLKLPVFVVLLLGVVAYHYLGEDFLSNNTWSFGFFTSVADFLAYGLSGDNIVSTLISDHVVIPSTASTLLFGTGISLFGGSEIGNSDIGYIIQLNYGGLAILLAIFFLVMYMFARLVKVLGWSHWYSWIFPLSILVLNFKGFVFAMTPGGRLLVLLYIFYLFDSVHGRSPRQKVFNKVGR